MYGPVLLENIKAAIAEKALPSNVKICPVGGKDWTHLTSLEQLAPKGDVPMFQPKPPGTNQGHKEYKVLSQKDKWFSGKFDPSRLEEALNAYAKQGWQVVSCASADINTLLGGARQEMVIILERNV